MKALIACVLCLTACGGATRSAADPTTQPAAPALEKWVEYHQPGAGLFAAFPTPAREFSFSEGRDESQIDTIGFESTSESTELVCVRTSVHHDRAEDDIALENMTKGLFDSVAKKSPVTALGYRGVVVEGKAKKTKLARNARIFIAGNSVVFGVVTHKQAKPALDAATTSRFLDACRFEIPWRLYPWPAAGLVISMPSYAIELDEKALKLPDDMVGRTFYLGGEHSLMFLLSSSPVEREDASVTDDLLLEGSIEGLESTGVRIITRSPIEFRGARGVDLLFESEKQHARWRLLVTQTRLYQVGVYANDKQALRQPEAKRFIESLRWNGDE